MNNKIVYQYYNMKIYHINEDFFHVKRKRIDLKLSKLIFFHMKRELNIFYYNFFSITSDYIFLSL